MNGRTIAAISTPRGTGGIAVIRISGDDALSILNRCFSLPNGKPCSELPHRYAAYGNIIGFGGDIIDTGVATVFRAPASFTGEDVAEISCHGGIAVTQAVLDAVLAAGAEMADAGEFTRRAFVNGKLTLSEAEAVGNLIEADTDSKMRLASAASRGVLSRKIDELYRELCDVMTALYAAIDYPEEDVGTEGEDNIRGVIDSVSAGVKKLLDTYKSGRAVAHGISTVICGKPNSGKSSIYNALAGEDRAIVTGIAGTTRDVLEDTVSCGGATLRLADTAGLRDDSSDEVENIGIGRAWKKIADAELILAVYDGHEPLTDEDMHFAKKLKEAAPDALIIGVINKNDLGIALSDTELDQLKATHDRLVMTSALSGDISELAEAIGDMYGTGKLTPSETPVIWEARHKAALMRALELLCAADSAFEDGAPIDAACTLCESALTELAALDGRGVSDDIIAGIFSKFCVGK